MRLDFCKDRFIGQQSTEGVGQMLLVAFGVASLRLVCSFPIRAPFGLLLARHGPDSFLTEVSSVGQPQGMALLSHFLLISKTPISLEEILHGVACWGKEPRCARLFRMNQNFTLALFAFWVHRIFPSDQEF
jgi:hypothetical protein